MKWSQRAQSPTFHKNCIAPSNTYSDSNLFEGVRIAHAATFGGMIINFGNYIARILCERGAMLHFIASNRPIYGLNPPVVELENLGGSFYGIDLDERVSISKSLKALIKMIYLLKHLRIEILHTRGAIMGSIGRIAGKLARVPIIFHHQDDLYARDKSHGLITHYALGMLEASLSRLSHKSFFVSSAVFEDALKLGFKRNSSVVVWNDLHQVFLTAMSHGGVKNEEKMRNLFSESGMPSDGIVIGCIARLLPLKGIDTLIRIASVICGEYPQCCFFIKGDGPLKEELTGQIRNLGLQARVFLCDKWVAMEDIPALYKLFDIFLLPTRREGFGMVFAEAMAMGLPVVGPKIHPILQVVGEENGFLVEPENINEYCAALRRLIDNPDLRMQIGKRATVHSLEKYSGEKSAHRVIEVYKDALAIYKKCKI